ncbi:MAG TPA: hypothetical protein PKA23_09425 [Accumulibacter sp.]|uniref:hypothetical protein n=1 Tax=Accumulibacter sp. TaxID=2053492 RepID=UPI002CE1659E|nr:hypothetical protein [Accumulibacter sp.]HMW80146.1 hypothetical protein [Accumulibacter sp.]HMX69205.1 hypothetical protein [Accumulibacter sp.]
MSVKDVLLKFVPSHPTACFKERAAILCTRCGAAMVIVRTRISYSFQRTLAAGKRKAGKRIARAYLFSGILAAPDGSMWNRDSGFHRIPPRPADRGRGCRTRHRRAGDRRIHPRRNGRRGRALEKADDGSMARALRKVSTEDVKQLVAAECSGFFEGSAPGSAVRLATSGIGSGCS